DARRLLNILEIIIERYRGLDDPTTFSMEIIEDVLQQDYRHFDKQGDVFYEQISALHKSVRGSSPDGALYWFCRMLDGGCDPAYIARRIVRMASEDIGNADPRGLGLAMDA
ncbi:MAG TPA: recombination factor protein RarA, partial [Candidatus Berkiella sp.]|nr:recombination factor protein RarA [Candidatus Berkiella sp.]